MAEEQGYRGPKVTEASVHEACKAIKAGGQRVTYQRIIAKLGGGSPNDIQPHKLTWEERQIAAAAPMMEAPQEELPKGRAVTAIGDLRDVAAAFDHLQSAILGEVSTLLMTERDNHARQIAALQDSHQRELKARDERVSTAEADAATQIAEAKAAALEEAQGAAEMIAENQAEMNRLSTQVTELDTQLATAWRAIETSSAALQANADRIEDQEAEIAKLAQEVRLKGAENAELLKQIGALNSEAEKVPGLLERIITLEGDKRDLEGQVQRSKVVADSVPALKQQVETLKDNLAETAGQLRAATGRTESDATRILSLEATLEYERGLRSLVPPTDAVDPIDQIEEPRDAATNA